MYQTESIEDWLGCGGAPIFHDDVFDLFEATKGESIGRYDAFKRGKHVFITDPDAGRLHLKGARYVNQFKKAVERFNPHPELGIAGAAYFMKAMGK